MLCDRDFGVIKKKKRLCKCMVPEEVQEMVRSPRLEKPFEVISIEKYGFFILEVLVICT